MTSQNDVRRVRNSMSNDVVSIRSESSVHEALDLLVENRISALPVVDKANRCVGIISTTDLIDITRDVDHDVQYAEELDPTSRRWLIDRLIHTVGDEPLSSYMTENVSTVYVEDSLAKAAREMLKNRVHHMPVVDQREHLVGMISTMDILAEYVEETSSV